MRDDDLLKYPRTRHIEGSGLQKGDHDLKTVPFGDIGGRHLVIEEKVDGANVGLSFSDRGDLRLQCRGHYLTGGPGEAQFSLLKQWAETHRWFLNEVLGRRYICYGEWLYAKHTVFYDQLPHYFLEFDIYDRESGDFLSTERRRAMLASGPVVSMPVVSTGPITKIADIERLVQRSLYKSSNWRNRLREAAVAVGSDPVRVLESETDRSDLSEGLYIKWEEDGRVVDRYKWVRTDFLNAILDSGSHWNTRTPISNQTRLNCDLFANA